MPPRLLLARGTQQIRTGRAAGQVTSMQQGESELKRTAPGRGLGLGEPQGSVRFALQIAVKDLAAFCCSVHAVGCGPLKMRTYVLVSLSCICIY